jgi:putative transposase
MVYIDLNMVRAGVVKHPSDWPFCGYQEIIGSRQRYRLIDKNILIELFNLGSEEELKIAYNNWIESRLNEGHLQRESHWTESLAVGSKDFVANIKDRLGIKVKHRNVTKGDIAYEL